MIREFIQMGGKYEEYFPASALESSYDHTAPSAALLKAILITSTLSLVSSYDENSYTVNLETFYGPGEASGYNLGTSGLDFSQGKGVRSYAISFFASWSLTPSPISCNEQTRFWSCANGECAGAIGRVRHFSLRRQFGSIQSMVEILHDHGC